MWRRLRREAHIQILVNCDVLVFDIPMSDTMSIKVVHRVNDLRKNVAGLILRQTLVRGLLYALE